MITPPGERTDMGGIVRAFNPYRIPGFDNHRINVAEVEMQWQSLHNKPAEPTYL